MFANVRTDAHHSRRICIPSMLDLPPPGLRVNVFGGNGVIMGTLSFNGGASHLSHWPGCRTAFSCVDRVNA